MNKCDDLIAVLHFLLIECDDIEKISYTLKHGVEKLYISFIESSKYQIFNYFEKGFYLLKVYDNDFNLILKKDFVDFNDLYNLVKE